LNYTIRNINNDNELRFTRRIKITGHEYAMNNLSNTFAFLKRILKGTFILFVFIWCMRASLFVDAIGAPLNTTSVSLPKEQFAVTSFSPDSKRLYLEYSDVTGKVRIGWMDLVTKKVSLFEPENSQDQLFAARSSANGKQLAIVIKESEHNFETSQIGIVDLQSKTYREITRGNSYRQFPTFSRDGKKIIYAISNHIRRSGHTRFSGWDIYEVNVNTGIERRLSEYCFFAVTAPYYLGDGDKFVFSGESPMCNFPSSSNEDYKSYARKYRENDIFLRSVGKKEPLEPLLQHGDYSSFPSLTEDGRIFYVSMDYKEYNYDIFVYQDGAYKRLTDLKTLMQGIVVSPHGDLVAYTTEDRGNLHTNRWLMNVMNGARIELNFGDSKTFQTIKVVNQFKGRQQ
jgi:Tol biopolymer transport system component